MNHLLVKEIKRQLNQGFAEKKDGQFKKNYAFSMKLSPCSGLTIIRKEVMYRLMPKSDFSIDIAAVRLGNLPSSDYEPFKEVMTYLCSVLSNKGKVQVSKFGIIRGGILCIVGEEMSLTKTILNYRYGDFYAHFENDVSLRFGSEEIDGNLSDGGYKNKGEIKIYFPFRELSDLNLNKIEKVSIYLDDITENLVKKYSNVVRKEDIK